MALPYFYIEDISSDVLTLDEDTSKHVVQVLRKKSGDDVLLTDGKGAKAIATITDDNRKRCAVRLGSRERQAEPQPRVCIAISLIKNASRFEWFLEKATEIGVREIIPLLCERTEKEKFRHDRLNSISVSAMLQSQQCWLPVLHGPTDFGNVVTQTGYHRKFIGHCLPQERVSLPQLSKDLDGSSMMLIGPEGDFTKEEIEMALQQGVTAVMLGDTRLRTETAGIVAATLLRCR